MKYEAFIKHLAMQHFQQFIGILIDLYAVSEKCKSVSTSAKLNIPFLSA